MTFYEWLGEQTRRSDDVGTFARYATRDKVFPRHARKLGLFLSRYEGMPEQRRQVKLAHDEWRKSQSGSAA